MFNEHHRIGADLLGGLNLFDHISDVARGAVTHILVEPGQVFGRVLSREPQRLTEFILAKRMSIGAFSGVVAPLIVVAFAEPSGRRAV
ncbi:hypothetical protein SDC9_120864 [bioreactor metagenome]|uniref:Uncharacterized protein n=1 Tax=bioreactor metagenome TaxID=1076179 RepID=A0A645CAC6_9ZZZZ